MTDTIPRAHRMRAIAVFAAWLASSGLHGAEGASRLEIVDRSIEHHGGPRFESSLSSFDLCSKSGCSAVRVWRDGGLFDYDVKAPIRGIERRVRFTNESLELWEDGRGIPVDGERRSQQLRDWGMQRIYFSYLPYRLNDPSVRKQDLGREEWFGRFLRKIKVTFVPGSSTDASDEYLFWFDPESARLELFAYSYETSGGGLRFRRLFNYRRVGGILFYDQENWGVEGAGLSVDLMTEEYVDSSMWRVSTVELRNIEVEPLP